MAHWTLLAKEQREYQEKYKTKIDAETQRKIRYICAIEDSLDGILQVVTGRLWPGTQREFLDSVKAQCSIGVDTASVFPNVISEVATLVKADGEVARVLSANLPQLFQKGVLSESALASLGNALDFLVTGLLKVETTMKGNHGLSPDSRRRLLDILGGLLVLSVEPSWVAHCRQKYEQGGIPLPGTGETASLGPGRTFSWLQLSLAALADSRARLNRVFLNPDVDGRRVAPMPIVHESIGAKAEFDAVKAHLIRCVLGDQELGNPDLSDVSQRRKFEQAYQDALEIMKVARLDERDPFYTCDASWVKASKTLRSDLQLSDLLLFSSPEAEPGKFLNSHIRVLSAFYRLFDLLK